jgi:hypothetical protein
MTMIAFVGFEFSRTLENTMSNNAKQLTVKLVFAVAVASFVAMIVSSKAVQCGNNGTACGR